MNDQESNMTNKTYRVVKYIHFAELTANILPAGSTRRFGVPFISVLTAISKDSTAELLMPLDEAIEHGIVEEETPKLLLDEVPNYAWLIPLDDWSHEIFGPDDGTGSYATKTEMDLTTSPHSGVEAPEWATHVAWFPK